MYFLFLVFGCVCVYVKCWWMCRVWIGLGRQCLAGTWIRFRERGGNNWSSAIGAMCTFDLMVCRWARRIVVRSNKLYCNLCIIWHSVDSRFSRHAEWICTRKLTGWKIVAIRKRVSIQSLPMWRRIWVAGFRRVAARFDCHRTQFEIPHSCSGLAVRCIWLRRLLWWWWRRWLSIP